MYVRIDLSITDSSGIVARLKSNRQGKVGQLINRVLSHSSDAIKLLESVTTDNIERVSSTLTNLIPSIAELKKEIVSDVPERVEQGINQLKAVSRKFVKTSDQQDKLKLQSKIEYFQTLLNELSRA